MKKIVFLLIALCLVLSLAVLTPGTSQESSRVALPADLSSSDVRASAVSGYGTISPYPTPPIPNKKTDYEKFAAGMAHFTSNGVKRDLNWSAFGSMITDYLGYTNLAKWSLLNEEETALYQAYGVDNVWRLRSDSSGLTVDLLIFPTYSDAMEFYEYLSYEVEEQSYREQLLVLTDSGRNWAYCRAERGGSGGGMCFGVAENTLLLARADYYKGVSLAEADRIFTLSGIRESDVKQPLSETGFNSMAERAGMAVYPSDHFNPRDNDGLSCVCMAESPERTFGDTVNAEFFIFDSEASAKAYFNKNYADLESWYGDDEDCLYEHTSGRNWEAVRMQKLDQDWTEILIRVDNTVLSMYVDDINAIEGDRVVAILGY